MTYPQVHDGEWIEPIRRGYRFRCCDCSLIHVVNFRLVNERGGRVIQIQFFRDKRATKRARKTTP